MGPPFGQTARRMGREVAADGAARRRRPHQRHLAYRGSRRTARRRSSPAARPAPGSRWSVLARWPSDAYRSASKALSRPDVAGAVHDFHEQVPARQDRHTRPLEDERAAAGMQRLGHHGAAELRRILRPPHQNPRRVRRVVGRTGDEVLLGEIREVLYLRRARHHADRRNRGYIRAGPLTGPETDGTGGHARRRGAPLGCAAVGRFGARSRRTARAATCRRCRACGR